MNDAALQQLMDKRAIEDLRYTYWFALLDKNIDGVVGCFCDDIKLDYGWGIELNGKIEALDFFTNLLNSPDLIRQVPRGANGMIDIVDKTTATGRWLVEAITLRKDQAVGSLASVQYFEQYAKVSGQWRIASLKNEYLYFESVALRDNP